MSDIFEDVLQAVRSINGVFDAAPDEESGAIYLDLEDGRSAKVTVAA